MGSSFKTIVIGFFGFGLGGLLAFRQVLFLYRFLTQKKILERMVTPSKQLTSLGILLPAGIVLIIWTYLLIKQRMKLSKTSSKE